MVGAVEAAKVTQTAAVPEAAKKSCGVCNTAESTNYLPHATGTLGRGITNAALGWTELFAQPVRAGKAGDNVLVGVGKGLGHTIKRTLLGLGEVLTFWVPPGSLVLADDCAFGTMGLTDR